VSLVEGDDDELPWGVVEGCELLGAVPCGEVDPGVVVFGVPLGEVDPGVVVFGVPFGEVDPGCVVFGVVEPGVVVFGVPFGDVEPGALASGDVEPGVVDPGVAGLGVPLGELEPEVVAFGEVPFGDVEPGEVWVVPAGGVAVLPGAVVLPGVELCPAVPELPDGAVLPPDGELWAATHAPQHRITASNVSFLIDFIVTSHPCFKISCSELSPQTHGDNKLEYGGEPVDGVSGGLSTFRTGNIQRKLAQRGGRGVRPYTRQVLASRG